MSLVEKRTAATAARMEPVDLDELSIFLLLLSDKFLGAESMVLERRKGGVIFCELRFLADSVDADRLKLPSVSMGLSPADARLPATKRLDLPVSSTAEADRRSNRGDSGADEENELTDNSRDE